MNFTLRSLATADLTLHPSYLRHAYQLIKSNDAECAQFASRPDLPADLIEQLICSKSATVRASVLARPDLDPKRFEELLTNEKRAGVLKHLLSSPSLSAQHLASILRVFRARPH